MAISRILSTTMICGIVGAFSSVASAKTCPVEIQGTDQMTFDKKEIAVAADCTEVALTLKHVGKMPVAAMGHNWVLTETATMQPVATAGMSAGAAASYVPKGDARVLAFTKLIGGGQSTTITFPTTKLKKGGDYSYFCSFPGHWAVMKGKFKFG
jgi:azurin